MGRVFRSEDVARGRRKVVEEAVRDLSPGIREATVRIIDSWVDRESKDAC